jgi:hypothetical protein
MLLRELTSDGRYVKSGFALKSDPNTVDDRLIG